MTAVCIRHGIYRVGGPREDGDDGKEIFVCSDMEYTGFGALYRIRTAVKRSLCVSDVEYTGVGAV